MHSPHPTLVAAFSAEFQDIKLTIQVFRDEGMLPLQNARALPKALLRKIKDQEWGYYDLVIRSEYQGQEACHILNGQLLPTGAADLEQELGVFLEEDGALENIHAYWSELQEAEKRKGVPAWGTPLK